MKDEANFCANIEEAIQDYAVGFYKHQLVGITLAILKECLAFPMYLNNSIRSKDDSSLDLSKMIEEIYSQMDKSNFLLSKSTTEFT